MKTWTIWIVAAAAAWAGPVAADWREASCDIYPKGEDHSNKSIHCTFAQRQGYITITREDGISHDLTPKGDRVGNFLDQDGHTVYRQSGLGDQGVIFRFPTESVFVYWNAGRLEPADPSNPTWPFTTKGYHATTLLRCRGVADAEFEQCPAGILRMENRQASVVIQNQAGEQFTINFMTDYVNATNRKAEAKLNGDTWSVTIDDKEIYEVPLAAIEGG
ncbi:MAG: hypothetical protein KDG50_12625 [Chromatiales bacterium]|nr:hypothetical protein [Chromatiales bacterium]